MDTPDRSQIGAASLSKFEDSPVYNFINSLSPIKADNRSLQISHTFNSLSFVSPPSVFTSPHVTSHKESRLVRRFSNVDPSPSGHKVHNNDGVVTNVDQPVENSLAPKENFSPGPSMTDMREDPSDEHSKSVVEEPQALKYDSGSPECDPSGPCGVQEENASEFGGTSILVVPYDQEVSANESSAAGTDFQEMSHSEQRKDGTGYDWENLIPDATDLLIFSSPNGSEAIRLVPKPCETLTGLSAGIMTHFIQHDYSSMEELHIADHVGSGGHQNEEDFSSQPGEACELKQLEQTLDSAASDTSEHAACNSTDLPFSCKNVSNLHRGMRRRCLDFEAAGALAKNLAASSSSNSMILHSDEKIVSNEKQLVRMKIAGDPSRRVLTGIGLHLNALATSSKEYKTVNTENFGSGRHLILPGTGRLQSPTSSQEHFMAMEKEKGPSEDGVVQEEDGSQPSAYGEELSQNSPKKKRRRMEHTGESEACKRCNCKKSKCLKLYCECFAAGVYCIEPCSCQDCFNKPIHEDTVLATRKQIESRNPLAFAPKVIRSSDSVPELGDESSKTPASARHKRGCNCKKSSCLKKYCECFQGGVGCSIGCRCEGCKNTYGRKDGSAPLCIEAEQEEEETEPCRGSVVDKALQGTEIQANEEHIPASAHPKTPLQLCRTLAPLPFSSRIKPSCSFLGMGSSSALSGAQKLENRSVRRPQPKLEKHLRSASGDEMPPILRENGSPSTGIKTSPNSKRISPPQSEFGSSSLPRIGRKLILQSIPSFPSLTPQHN